MTTTLTEHYRALGALIIRRYAARGKVAGRDRDQAIDDEIAADAEALAALAAIRALQR